MATVTVHEAKTHLSKLIARAEAGEEVVIAQGAGGEAGRRPAADIGAAHTGRV